MTEAPLIRRAVTADRGARYVNTEVVLACIAELPLEWTTVDVARRMNVPEYSVRAAVFWLMNRGEVKPAGTTLRQSPKNTQSYRVRTYRLIIKEPPTDFAALYRSLGLVVA